MMGEKSYFIDVLKQEESLFLQKAWIIKDYNNIFYYVWIIIIFFIVFLSGCGDSSGGGYVSDSAAPLLEGVFIDSPVEGLEYETETRYGITDAEGTFMYHEGDTMRFSVGDIILGEAPAKPMMTPVDLFEGATDETHPMVINMARFIQTLDEDMDLENGITITEEMINALIGHMIDFDMDPEDFENNLNVQMVMDTLNEIDHSGPMRMLVSVEDAQNHLRHSMNGMMLGSSDMMGDDVSMMK